MKSIYQKMFLLLLSLCGFAGEISEIYPIGYSADNKYFAYAELITFDGVGSSEARIRTLDVVENQYVSGAQVTLKAKSAEVAGVDSRFDLLVAAKRQAIKKWAKLKIAILNDNYKKANVEEVPQATNAPDGQYQGQPKSTTLNFTPFDTAPLLYPYSLELQEVVMPVQPKDTFSGRCSYEEMPCAKMGLFAFSPNGSDKPALKVELQLDDTLPTPRAGIYGYGFKAAGGAVQIFLPLKKYYFYEAPAGSTSSSTFPVVVMIAKWGLGFEGPSIDYMPISGLIPVAKW